MDCWDSSRLNLVWEFIKFISKVFPEVIQTYKLPPNSNYDAGCVQVSSKKLTKVVYLIG
jgi:hypothetical protein